ncbi:zinc-binding dehydrogenase [Parahaliea sp. F7430]|uniref:Zinc-binding dehydrogenase n=1 Tax=Sediminihaliea albiluteola TaxID=2758564 RepID=A0A7W2YIV0_9GAMM|nr:zinc-binding dehydrogenase [Sediminihaliea albiluteola]MBA6412447.1 zinc-binding dehydrogenase [Sediminihaliea albiluteola]
MSTALQLRSLVTEDGKLELSLQEVEIPKPGPEEVLVKVEAAPINPSDLALLTAFADLSSAQQSGSAERPVITADIPAAALRLLKGRLGQSLAVGNEGAGEVIAAGDSEAAQALMGKTVGIVGGETFAQYRCVHHMQCLPLEEGTTAVAGASCFVNPMTSLAMVETMRMEDHSALVHTAAASNLGQMLNRICLADGIPLINVVRRAEQEKILRDLGAKYVVNSSADDFLPTLTEAIAETGATLAFDATGGGKLGSQILNCMEAAAARQMSEYNRYGSETFKQLYIYGGLDPSATTLQRTFGFAWSVSGWLLPLFLKRVGIEKMLEMRARVASEIHSTFASHYNREVSLAAALDLDTLRDYSRQATGAKYLIRPQH